ncbi:MAG: FtsQ-type POTRA domain-containing protein [Nitrospirae bacterium]|nr:FtsQ-type POTRA domain-containing protein [Nitrospirota bacterium]
MSYSDIAIGRRYQKKGILRRRIIVRSVSIVVISLGLYYILLGIEGSIAPLFTVSSVKIAGLYRLKEEEIISLSGIGSGVNILQVDLDEVYQRIKENPWVRDVQIRKELPVSIAVEIIERRPEARVAAKNGTYLVDNEGMVLERADMAYDFLPLIKGLDHIEISPGKRVDWKNAGEGLEIIKMISSDLTSDTHNNPVVDLSRSGEIKLLLQGYTLRIGTGTTRDEIARFLDVKEEINRRFSGPREIDLRFPKRIIVRQPGGERGIG